MPKKTKIIVKGSEITIVKYHGDDYISLTDMVRNFEDGPVLIEKWLRNKNTIEFIGIWEQINNPSFNSPEFGGIMNEAGFNRFTQCCAIRYYRKNLARQKFKTSRQYS